MNLEAAFTTAAENSAKEHLLQHYAQNRQQEDLCFALWRPSAGQNRLTALIDEIILPRDGERGLHGNASCQPIYLTRAIKLAQESQAGLAFMHSHPTRGWQGMSHTDIETERDFIAYPAGATNQPLAGLTVGTDGYWSARFWKRQERRMRLYWCHKVRVAGQKSYSIYFNDDACPAPPRQKILKRTFDTWGQDSRTHTPAPKSA